MKPHVLSLFDFTGNWSRPWLATHTVEQVDLKHGQNVLNYRTKRKVDVLLAAPPCTVWARSGAWVQRSESEFLEAFATLAAVASIVRETQPRVWALENPAGFVERLIGKPQFVFQPWEYGDDKSKRTCLRGKFTPPLPLLHGSGYLGQPSNAWLMKLGGKSDRTKEIRSATPEGFALAFYRANLS